MIGSGMPILNAVGSSLLSVGTFGLTTAANYALSGLIDWTIAFLFIAGGLFGGMFGMRVAINLSKQRRMLTSIFAGVIFVVAIYMLGRTALREKHMTTTIVIPCPHCHTINRVLAERRGDGGKCGRCHQPLFTGKPINLDAAHFDRHAGAADLPLLIDFWAAWCGPCRAMAPAFEAAARELEPRLRLGKVDTDAEQQLAARYGIQAIPTIILVRGGQELARHSGAMPAGTLRDWVDRHLAA
jgi:thioredoxin 2